MCSLVLIGSGSLRVTEVLPSWLLFSPMKGSSCARFYIINLGYEGKVMMRGIKTKHLSNVCVKAGGYNYKVLIDLNIIG